MTQDELRDEMRHPQGDPRRTGVRPEDEPAPEVPEDDGDDDVRNMTTDERRRKRPERLDIMPPATGPIALNDEGPKTGD